MISFLSRALMLSTPLMFGATAEVFAQRSGVMITAVEGIFTMGAWAGFVGSYVTGSHLYGFLFAMAAGLITAALHGWICVYLGQQQVVTGTAINIMALGTVAFFQRVIFGVPILPLQVTPLAKISVPILSDIPFIGPILFQQNVLTYLMYFMVPVAFFVLFRTSLGLAIRSTGENPEAVDVAGINVKRIRFSMVLIAGVIGGLAGSFYSIGYLGMFSPTMIGGRGWIAFAICFLGNWNPVGVLAGTLVFGLAEAFAVLMQSGGAGLFPNELFIALPYIVTIVLTISRRSFNVPAKLGVPYNKED